MRANILKQLNKCYSMISISWDSGKYLTFKVYSLFWEVRCYHCCYHPVTFFRVFQYAFFSYLNLLPVKIQILPIPQFWVNKLLPGQLLHHYSVVRMSQDVMQSCKECGKLSITVLKCNLYSKDAIDNQMAHRKWTILESRIAENKKNQWTSEFQCRINWLKEKYWESAI